MSNLYVAYFWANTIGAVVALVGGFAWLRRQEKQRQQQS